MFGFIRLGYRGSTEEAELELGYEDDRIQSKESAGEDTTVRENNKQGKRWKGARHDEDLVLSNLLARVRTAGREVPDGRLEKRVRLPRQLTLDQTILTQLDVT